MKSYIIEEILPEGMTRIISFLNKNAGTSGMEKLFWAELPRDHLNHIQNEHTGCSPFRFAIETGDDWIKAEFYIRASSGFRCECNGCCDDSQRDYIMQYIDTMLSELNIST